MKLEECIKSFSCLPVINNLEFPFIENGHTIIKMNFCQAEIFVNLRAQNSSLIGLYYDNRVDLNWSVSDFEELVGVTQRSECYLVLKMALILFSPPTFLFPQFHPNKTK